MHTIFIVLLVLYLTGSFDRSSAVPCMNFSERKILPARPKRFIIIFIIVGTTLLMLLQSTGLIR